MKNYFVICLILTILTACAPANSAQVNATITLSKNITTTLSATPSPSETLVDTIPASSTATSTITLTNKPLSTPRPTNDPGFLISLGWKNSGPSYNGIPLFSPDGKLIALALSPRIRFWDTQTHQLVLELKNPYVNQCDLINIVFSDDGTYFAASITECTESSSSLVPAPPGHLLVWEMSTGTLIHDWEQDYAFMVDSRQGEFSIPVDAMVFLPNSTKLAYGTGNSIAIRDVKELNAEPEYLDLGSEMYATDITVRDDSEYLFVLMHWYLWRDFPANYREEYELQSWHLTPNYLNFTRGLDENDRWLIHKDNLLHFDNANLEFEVKNLTTNAVSQFPFPSRWPNPKFFNSDLSLMIDACFVCDYGSDESLDLWDTDTWQKLYSFIPDSWTYGFFIPDGIVFSPDNTMVAIAHNEQVTLWNINAIVNPNSEP